MNEHVKDAWFCTVDCVVANRYVLDAAVLCGSVSGEGVHIWRALQPAETLLS